MNKPGRSSRVDWSLWVAPRPLDKSLGLHRTGAAFVAPGGRFVFAAEGLCSGTVYVFMGLASSELTLLADAAVFASKGDCARRPRDNAPSPRRPAGRAAARQLHAVLSAS